MLQGPEGRLIFEDDQGNPNPITAEQLSVLLRQHHIPAIVLNACQSAMVDQGAKDPFASVAAALLKSGIRSVVAMAYSLYVSGAQEFLPAFYRDLFRTGNVAKAARAGRQRMFQQKDRVCPRGRYPLDDWLVPVVYQQEPFDFSFAAKAKKAKADGGGPELPGEARDTENPYGFIGRDGAVLALERAMRRPPAGLLIQGLGGVGKTTLARGSAMAPRHRRPGEGRLLVHIPGHPLRRVRLQPHGGSPLRPAVHHGGDGCEARRAGQGLPGKPLPHRLGQLRGGPGHPRHGGRGDAVGRGSGPAEDLPREAARRPDQGDHHQPERRGVAGEHQSLRDLPRRAARRGAVGLLRSHPPRPGADHRPQGR